MDNDARCFLHLSMIDTAGVIPAPVHTSTTVVNERCHAVSKDTASGKKGPPRGEGCIAYITHQKSVEVTSSPGSDHVWCVKDGEASDIL